MSKSSEKDRKVVDRRTKAQLVQALVDAQATLQKKNSEIASCSKDLQNAKAKIKELQKLKVKLEPEAADLNKAERALKENKNMEKEIQELKEQLEEYKKKITTEEQEKEIIKDFTAPSKPRTFTIYFSPRQGHFKGWIYHQGTGNKELFTGLDSDVICKFISEYLNQVAEKEKMSLPATHADEKLSEAKEKKISLGAKMRVSIRPKTKSLQATTALKELKLQQMERFLEPGAVLQAFRPFALYAQLHFPVVPRADNLDIETSNYEVLVIMADAKKENVVARRGAADILSAEVADYENKINMPGLAPGKYWMKIHTLAPFANIEESKEILLNFQP